MSSIAAIVQVRRVDRVDAVVRERGWSLTVARELAIEFGCSIKTVYNYWNRTRRWTQATMKAGDLDLWRAQHLQQLSEVAVLARDNKDYKSAVRAIETQAKITGAIAPMKAEVTVSGTVLHVPVGIAGPESASVPPRSLSADELSGVIEAEFEAVGSAESPAGRAAPSLVKRDEG